MKKGATQLSIASLLFMAAASFSFQGQEEVPRKQPLVIKDTALPKQFRDSLNAARREFDLALKRNDSLMDVRQKNFNTLESNVAELKEANKIQKRAIGRLVNILRNFPADSTLKTFDMEGYDSIPVDTVKKKIELPQVEPQKARKPFFKRLFKRND